MRKNLVFRNDNAGKIDRIGCTVTNRGFTKMETYRFYKHRLDGR